MDAYTFLVNYFRGLSGSNWIELTYIHPDKAKYPHPVIDFVEVGNNTALQAALAHASELNRGGWGVYFGVCPRKVLPPKGKRGNEAEVDTLIGFYTELDSTKEGRTPEDDLARMQAAEPAPSFCVLSGGGVHAYWLLDRPTAMTDDKRQLIKSALRGIGEKFGGDSAVAEFARVLRVPGFVNTKPGRDARPVTYVPPTQKHRYSINDLLRFAPKELPKPQRKLRQYPMTDAVEMAQAALKVLAPSRREVYNEWFEVGASLVDLGPTGLELWHQFSAGAPNYDPESLEKHWKRFNGKVHLGSLYRWADKDSGSTLWRPYKPPIQVDRDFNVAPTDNKLDAYWPDGLPIALRSTLVEYGYSAVAPVLELWCEGLTRGIIPGGEITTVQCLLKVSKQLERNLTESAIRSGLNQGCVQFLQILSHNSIGMEEGSIQHKVTVTEDQGGYGGGEIFDCDCPCKNPLKAGREATYYRLLPPRDILMNAAKLAIVPILTEAFPPERGIVAPIHAEFLSSLGVDDAEAKAAELQKRYKTLLEQQPGYQAALDRARLEYKRLVKWLNNDATAPIPAGLAYQNAAQYQAACARAIIEAAGGETQYSRATWCEKLGCTDRNLTVIFKRAGIRMIKKQTVDVPVSLDKLKAMPAAYDKETKGFPKAVVSSIKPDAPYGFAKKGLHVWAAGETAIGATLSVRYQRANRQTLEPAAVIEVPKPRLMTSQVIALRAIISFMIANWVDSEPVLVEETTSSRPERTFPALWRFNRVLRISYQIRWAIYRLRPASEVWLDALAEISSAWEVKGTKMIDKSSGEIREHTVESTLDALLEQAAPVEDAQGEAPQPVPYSGMDLYRYWKAFEDPDARDDWYLELAPDDKLALIECRHEMEFWADDPLVAAMLEMGGVVTSVEPTVLEEVA